MVDATLIEYVKKALGQGLSAESITRSLLANGWSELAIKEAIEAVSMPDIPKGPGFINPAPAPQPQQQTKSLLGNNGANSSYSVLLAVVLLFGLLILANKIINDLTRHFENDITGQLIFQAIVILPFLIAAFALQYSLTGRGEKYRILSQPYYIVSGWLLIRLLYNVSQYILTTQVVYGVYIVLVLIVGVLTGVIFFVQKYLKHKD